MLVPFFFQSIFDTLTTQVSKLLVLSDHAPLTHSIKLEFLVHNAWMTLTAPIAWLFLVDIPL